jgi:hypothetical protein
MTEPEAGGGLVPTVVTITATAVVTHHAPCVPECPVCNPRRKVI